MNYFIIKNLNQELLVKERFQADVVKEGCLLFGAKISKNWAKNQCKNGGEAKLMNCIVIRALQICKLLFPYHCQKLNEKIWRKLGRKFQVIVSQVMGHSIPWSQLQFL
jgi:hypothetical protein